MFDIRRKRSLATNDDEIMEKIMHLTNHVVFKKGVQHNYKVHARDADEDIDDDEDLDAENEDIAIEEDTESDASVRTTETLERDEVKQKQVVNIMENLGSNVTELLEHPKSAAAFRNNNDTRNATQNATEKSSGEFVLRMEFSQYLLLFVVLCLV